MGSYSTLRITRAKVREYLLGQILRADDDALTAMINEEMNRRLLSIRIVADDDASNDDDLL